MSDRIGAVAALLVEAERAHGTYETTELNGVYDEAWASWYAAYALDHGLADLLGREVAADRLAADLTAGFEEFKQADPPPREPWPVYLARRIAADR